MIISSNCPAATTDTEEGCFPLSYIFYAAAFLAFLILVIGIRVWYRHVTTRRLIKKRNKNIDLEDRAVNSRLDLHRKNTDISLPPSYHSTEDTLVVPAPHETATPAYEVADCKRSAPGRSAMSSGSTKGRKERPNLRIYIPSTPQTGIVLAQPDNVPSPKARQTSMDLGDGSLYPMPEHCRDSMDFDPADLASGNGGSKRAWEEEEKKKRIRG